MMRLNPEDQLAILREEIEEQLRAEARARRRELARRRIAAMLRIREAGDVGAVVGAAAEA